MTYHTLIRHQELVALLGTRNLQLRLVYAHIANYTQARGAWCGEVKELAAQLELPIQTVRDQLKVLTTKGLVMQDGNAYTAAVQNDTRAVQNDTGAVQNDTRAVQNDTGAVQNPAAIINNEEMKRNEKYARETLATPDPKDECSFNRLALLYMQRIGSFQMSEAVRNDSRAIWENFPLWKRLLMLKELAKPTGQVRPRLDWTLSAFNPQPEFLSGPDQDEYWKSPEWVKNRKPLCKVLYQGLYKICTEETMRTFDLEFKGHVRQYVE